VHSHVNLANLDLQQLSVCLVSSLPQQLNPYTAASSGILLKSLVYGLIIVTLGNNISANSISAANDLMSFAPRYINIRRGQLLAAVIGSWGFVPVS
jgi:cytosine/uracil/thiamine/allantoin permease